MIAKLRGFIDSLQEEKCVIDVAGVGYKVFLSNKTSGFLKQFSKEQEVSLIVETIVKEDAIDLYGFAQEVEKIWFRVGSISSFFPVSFALYDQCAYFVSTKKRWLVP